MEAPNQKRPGRGPLKSLTDTQRVANLEAAAELLQEVADSLDLSTSTCNGCCGRLIVNNWAHKQVYDGLRELPKKLRRFSGRFLPGVDQGLLEEVG